MSIVTDKLNPIHAYVGVVELQPERIESMLIDTIAWTRSSCRDNIRELPVNEFLPVLRIARVRIEEIEGGVEL